MKHSAILAPALIALAAAVPASRSGDYGNNGNNLPNRRVEQNGQNDDLRPEDPVVLTITYFADSGVLTSDTLFLVTRQDNSRGVSSEKDITGARFALINDPLIKNANIICKWKDNNPSGGRKGGNGETTAKFVQGLEQEFNGVVVFRTGARLTTLDCDFKQIGP